MKLFKGLEYQTLYMNVNVIYIESLKWYEVLLSNLKQIKQAETDSTF